MEFRGHDNVVEVVVFAPIAAYPAIRELAGIPVSNNNCAEVVSISQSPRISILRSEQAHISPAEVEIN